MQPLLKITDATFGYTKKQKPLLNKVNLELYPGQRIGIIGDNGSGKSTIVKLLLGLHRLSTGEGKVELFGKPVLWTNHYPYLSYIGDPSHCPGELGLPMDISVGEVINSFRELWGSSQDLFCSEIIRLLKLDILSQSNVSTISTGERKKLMTFLALGKNTKLLIADEPTEGLDKKAKPIVINLIKETLKNQQLSLLWISHRPEEIAMLTNEVYELSEGTLIKSDVKGFNCGVENDLENHSQYYHNIDKDGILTLFVENLLNLEVSNFRVNVNKINV